MRSAESACSSRGHTERPCGLLCSHDCWFLGWYPQDADGCPIDVKVIPNGDGTFRCSYVPTKAIKHTIIISWGGVNVPKSPFRVCPSPVPCTLPGVPEECGPHAADIGCPGPSVPFHPQGSHKEAKTGQAGAGVGSCRERLALTKAHSLSTKPLPTGECGRRQPS